MKGKVIAAMGATLVAASSPGPAQTPASAPEATLHPDGSVSVPGFELPFSGLASPQARDAMTRKIERIRHMRTPEVVAEAAKAPNPVAGQRMISDKYNFMPSLERQRRRYAVDMTPGTIGGVEVQIFEPKGGVSAQNRKRVIINLHGGGFVLGWPLVSQIESIPIAAVGKIKVISVNYGLFPEAKFPRASEDVASVYRELLKSYEPSQIGIYGCSAGGIVASEAIAWFRKEKLPNPAAIVLASASLDPSFIGDSAYVTPRFGSVLPAPKNDDPQMILYFTGADAQDPLVWPSRDPKLLASYPPALFATGTRAGDMSSATRAHLDLLKAGVESQLALWDGLDHCFLYDPDMPESEEAYALITGFLEKHMGK
jgi:epsilon-lactone hydrolase